MPRDSAVQVYQNGDSPPQHSSQPDPKRSRLDQPEMVEDAARQRELRAAAAERRARSQQQAASSSPSQSQASGGSTEAGPAAPVQKAAPIFPEKPSISDSTSFAKDEHMSKQLPAAVAERLYKLLFGDNPAPSVLEQWCNQGFRFSTDPETSLGLVQRQGGPCGVLAPIQAVVLKQLLFTGEGARGELVAGSDEVAVAPDDYLRLTPQQCQRSLVEAIAEVLWCCADDSNKSPRQAFVVDLCSNASAAKVPELRTEEPEDLLLSHCEMLQSLFVVTPCGSESQVRAVVASALPSLQGPLGVMLVLISAILSRGIEGVESDRDDPGQPLITAPFGHASQEMVNLFLCGRAVANVFDGAVQLEAMTLQGIPHAVGFLTLLESLHYCTVGNYLKRPAWPIWVLGSESHYTVLFALTMYVQDDVEQESRETRIRRAFDERDKSGGGGFIDPAELTPLLEAVGVSVPANVCETLRSPGVIVWQDLWAAICQHDPTSEAHPPATVRKFELFHFNGIAKSSDDAVAKPALTRMRVFVPPKWTPAEATAWAVAASQDSTSGTIPGTVIDVDAEDEVRSAVVVVDDWAEPAQTGQIVDCIKTRWPRAKCAWTGLAPSIV
eukprot:jgi/Chlat1/8256/Chrsp78S00625